MNESTVFTGLNGFVWWVGVVENRKDPLNLGRCQIRIFGWHTDDKNLIPTADLPWAQPSLPVNNSKTFNTPIEGDWVLGFFFDGPLGQAPVYFGVLPGIPSPYTNNPQKGFSDPRTEADLLTAPNTPIITTSSDGSGTVVKNRPAQRNPDPSTTGYPNTNLLAINDLKNPPPSITQRIEENTAKIPGPEAKNISTAIAGACQGAASALQGITPQLTSLVPSVESLTSSIVPNTSQLTSGLAGLSGAASQAQSQLTSNLSGAASQAQSLLKSQQETLAKAQASVTSQIAEAQKAAAKATAQAQASLRSSLGDLQAKAGNIADEISKKLSSLAPASITTKTPVNLVNDNPNAFLGAVAPGPTVNQVAPNPIPAEVPLEKVGSTLNKSIENMISLVNQLIETASADLIEKLNKSQTMADLNSWVDIKGQYLSQVTAKTREIAKALAASGGDNTGIIASINKKAENMLLLENEFDAKYEAIRAKGG